MTTLSEKNEDNCSPSPSPKKLNRQLSIHSEMRSHVDGIPGCESFMMHSPTKEDCRSVKSDDSPMKKKYLSPTKRTQNAF